MTNTFPDRVDLTTGSLADPDGRYVEVVFVNHSVDRRHHVLDIEVDEAHYADLQRLATPEARIVAKAGKGALSLVVGRVVVKPMLGVGDRVHHTVVLEGTELGETSRAGEVVKDEDDPAAEHPHDR